MKEWLLDSSPTSPFPTPVPFSSITYQGDALCFVLAKCFVLANARRADQVYLMLDCFLPCRDSLQEEYELIDEDAGVSFADEAKLLSYLEANFTRDATRYWYPREKNPDDYMVGAHFTTDGCLLLSLTLPANELNANQCLARMKTLLCSDIGLIWYNNFPDFAATGENFRKQLAACA